MDRTKLMILVAVIGVLAILIVMVLSGGEEDFDQAEQDMMSSHDDVTMETTEDGVPIVSEDPVERLERYKKWAQYPPFSRPLFEGQVDLTDPYNAERPAVGVVEKPASGCTRDEQGLPRCESPAVFSDVHCKMTPESSISVGKPDFKITMHCSRKGMNPNDPKYIALDGLKTRVFRRPERQEINSLPPIYSGDTGSDGDATAGDNIYTFVVRPATTDWGYMHLEAEFSVDGKEHSQRASWFSTPHTVATFNSDGINDQLQDGHLVVNVPVNVSKAGYYEIDANLQEAEGEQKYIATARYEGDLAAGAQTVPMKFWGKVLKDKKASGRFTVREIRGMRHNQPLSPAQVRAYAARGEELPEVNYTEPLLEYMQPIPNYTTQAYRVEDWNNVEWESDEKTRRIEFLSSLSE